MFYLQCVNVSSCVVKLIRTLPAGNKEFFRKDKFLQFALAML